MLALTGFGLFSIGTVFADNTEECDEINWIPTSTLCYAKKIYYQNEQIIEKLDWNNCVILNKATGSYVVGNCELRFGR